MKLFPVTSFFSGSSFSTRNTSRKKFPIWFFLMFSTRSVNFSRFFFVSQAVCMHVYILVGPLPLTHSIHPTLDKVECCVHCAAPLLYTCLNSGPANDIPLIPLTRTRCHLIHKATHPLVMISPLTPLWIMRRVVEWTYLILRQDLRVSQF